YDVHLERLIVVSDDTALPVGALRIRRSGSSGGQKGLQSVIDCFGTNAVPRLRLGVRGENFQPGEPIDTYVLSRFSKKERSVVNEAIAFACDALSVFITEGVDAAMNRFNRSPEEDPAS
ncbi:MAG TPA: aminoacyl-tRNA hydrolase, partial [Thermoanaerobaculia bacterium]|nr:aminoacyl-tRNA hydrolase [Thermoanaerobaculia bacterium]